MAQQSFSPWASAVVQFAVSVIALCGAAWAVLATVGRPLFDNSVVAALRRKRPDVEMLLREQVFEQDLAKSSETHKAVDRLLVIAESNTEAIRQLLARQDEMESGLRALIALGVTVASCTKALDTLSAKLDDVGTRVDRLGGIVDELRRANTAASVGRLDPR